MKNELQNQIWNDLAEETKSQILDNYISADEENKKILENTFGKDNLSYIRTWKDIELRNDYDIQVSFGKCGFDVSASRTDEKLINKLVATLKIAKLISLGYGGMITDKDWEKDDWKYTVNIYNTNEISFDKTCHQRSFIAFKTEEYRTAFFSYQANIELVRDYFMCGKSKDIRMCLKHIF